MKQLMAGGGVALIGITLVPLLSGLFGWSFLGGICCPYILLASSFQPHRGKRLLIIIRKRIANRILTFILKGCRVVRLGDLKEKKRPHHVEKQLTNNSCWKGNWKTTSFNRDNGKLKISEVEQTALYLQSLQIESCLLLAIRFSDTDSWCPCILVLGYSIFSWLFRNCVYSSKKSITDAL